MSEVSSHEPNATALLNRWRELAKLTQGEAAKVLGYTSAQTISNKECGRKPVTRQDLKLIRNHAAANNIEL